jgi:predicted ATP-dependent endonuclease of OLD family
MAMTLAPELGVNDIRLGQGTGPNQNEGNLRFQNLLEEMVEKLQDPKRSKTAVATRTIKEQNGRIVQKLTSKERRYVLRKCNGKNKKGKLNNVFEVVADKLALEKIRQL